MLTRRNPNANPNPDPNPNPNPNPRITRSPAAAREAGSRVTREAGEMNPSRFVRSRVRVRVRVRGRVRGEGRGRVRAIR